MWVSQTPAQSTNPSCNSEPGKRLLFTLILLPHGTPEMHAQVNRKKVLILARDFPPYASSLGSVIRMLKLAEFLLDQGYEVHVLAARGEPISTFGYDSTLHRLHVTYVTDRFQVFNTRKWRGRISRTGGPAVEHNAYNLQWLAHRLRALAKTLLVPDPGVVYANRLATAAHRILVRERIHNVIVTSPPHSTQVAGYLLKRRLASRVNYLLDYRDSWNSLGLFAPRHPFTRWISKWMEARVLRCADHVTYQSSPVIHKLNHMFFNLSPKSTLVMNGFDPATVPPRPSPIPRRDYLQIGYFGAISDRPDSYRDPTPFLDAVARSHNAISVVFYGDIQLRHDWSEQLGARLEIHGNLPHQDALQEMSTMDVLMLLHTQSEGSDEVVPGKLFEYMAAGRPILAIGPSGMQALRIVANEGIGYTVDTDCLETLPAVLDKIYSDWEAGNLPRVDPYSLACYGRQVQYSKILPLLRPS